MDSCTLRSRQTQRFSHPEHRDGKKETHRARQGARWRQFYICSPCIPYRHQSDVTVWAQLQRAVLRLDTDPKQLDVLRRVSAHARVLLHTGGRRVKKTVIRGPKKINK